MANRKRGSHHICMFIIYLLIMPVLHSANVFAELNAGLYGQHKIPNFRRAVNDATTINLSASIKDEKVISSQIKLISDPTRPFRCTAANISETIYCRMTIPGDVTPEAHTYEIQLFKTDGTAAEPKKSLTIYADNLAPKIHSFGLVRNALNRHLRQCRQHVVRCPAAGEDPVS